jgi:hypothetical protein
MGMLDRLITFSEFDVFAYLVVGLVLLAVCDLIFHTGLILRPSWGFGAGLMIVVIAYVLGHLISIPGHWFIEEGIANRVLKAPQTLVSNAQCPDPKIPDPPKRPDQLGWLEVTIFAHDEPLSCAVLRKLEDKLEQTAASERHGDVLGDNYYFLLERGLRAARGDAYAYTRDRMQIFLRLYIFSRNMACVAFAGALIILVMAIYQRLRHASRKRTCRAFFIALWQGGAHVRPATETAQTDTSVAIPNWLSSRINLFLIFLIFGLGLLYRHVMFLRLYAGEALMAYAASANP